MIGQDTESKLKSMCIESGDFKHLFDVLAERKNNLGELTLDSLLAGMQENGGKQFARSVVFDFLSRLEGLGVGQAIIGRRGKKTRFRWDEPMLEVVAKAREGTVGNRDELHGARGQQMEPVRSTGKLVSHKFVLREDFTVCLELPSDLSGREAERLAGFVQTLPFNNNQ